MTEEGQRARENSRMALRKLGLLCVAFMLSVLFLVAVSGVLMHVFNVE